MSYLWIDAILLEEGQFTLIDKKYGDVVAKSNDGDGGEDNQNISILFSHVLGEEGDHYI